MKAREFAKRAVIYSLGLGIYAYELFVATVEGLGLNAKGFWGEPTHSVEPDDHVAPDPIVHERVAMYERAAADFDRWNKMTPADRANNIQSREQAWVAREKAALAALEVYNAECRRVSDAHLDALEAWSKGGCTGPYPEFPQFPPYPKEAEPIPQNIVVGAPFEKESLS